MSEKTPRYQDEDTGIDYELYFYCDQCHWAITTNKYGFGGKECPQCGSQTRRLRVDYPILEQAAASYEYSKKGMAISKS